VLCSNHFLALLQLSIDVSIPLSLIHHLMNENLKDLLSLTNCLMALIKDSGLLREISDPDSKGLVVVVASDLPIPRRGLLLC
jgi:hypothetical protein